MFIGLLLCFLVYVIRQKNKQRNRPVLDNPNQANVGRIDDVGNTNEVSRLSSLDSIYDEIELYQSARTERTHLSSAYTVLTRDPYAYDELYGLQRVVTLTHDPCRNIQLTQKRLCFKSISLPADLNVIAKKEPKSLTEKDYVDLLPDKLEAHTDNGNCMQHCVGRAKSMNDLVKTCFNPKG